MNKFLSTTLAVFLLSSCATVKMHRIDSEWTQSAQKPVKRIAVVTQPLPAEVAKAAELFSLVARRYVNQKRDFLVKEHRAQAEVLQLAKACTEGIEGILWLSPQLKALSKGVEGTLKAKLLRCADGKALWEAEAGGSFASQDDKLVEVKQQYVSELGEEVGFWVAPAFNLLRPTLDTLPNPELTDDEVGEKIELGE